jgi:hypothetical protein
MRALHGAAEELCVTQGAVSHQVKALATELAVKLPLGLTGTDANFATATSIASGRSRRVSRKNGGLLKNFGRTKFNPKRYTPWPQLCDRLTSLYASTEETK